MLPADFCFIVLIQEEIREKEHKCQKLSDEKEAKETSETELSSQVRSYQSQISKVLGFKLNPVLNCSLVHSILTLRNSAYRNYV